MVQLIDKAVVASQLARAHRSVDSGLRRACRLVSEDESTEASPSEPVKLLEVNENTFASGIVPVRFGRSLEVAVPSVIVEVTPEEFDRIVAGQLALPNGWRLGGEIDLE